MGDSLHDWDAVDSTIGYYNEPEDAPNKLPVIFYLTDDELEEFRDITEEILGRRDVISLCTERNQLTDSEQRLFLWLCKFDDRNGKNMSNSDKNKCVNCQHAVVCKHTDEYYDIQQAVKETIGEYPEWISIDLRCKNFKDCVLGYRS